jgi:hypothetical protein
MSLIIQTPNGRTWVITDPESAEGKQLANQTLSSDTFRRPTVPKRLKKVHTYDVAYRLKMITKMIHASAVEQSIKEEAEDKTFERFEEPDIPALEFDLSLENGARPPKRVYSQMSAQ